MKLGLDFKKCCRLYLRAFQLCDRESFFCSGNRISFCVFELMETRHKFSIRARGYGEKMDLRILGPYNTCLNSTFAMCQCTEHVARHSFIRDTCRACVLRRCQGSMSKAPKSRTADRFKLLFLPSGSPTEHAEAIMPIALPA